jgi:hypothetical protein
MSVERIGNGNVIANASRGAVRRQLQPSQVATDVKTPSVEKIEETVDLTRVVDPPFLPAGHTQTIFKERK